MHILDQQCPRCGATDCRLSDTGVVRLLVWPLWLRPVRCRRCRHRFWRFAPKVGGGKVKARRRKRSKGRGSDPDAD